MATPPAEASHMVEYTVVAVYLLLMVSVGFVLRRLNRDVSDYFRSGCRGTWWLVGSSAFMGAFSAWTFSGAAGAAFEAGWSVAVIYFANVVGFLINAALLAPWFRQMRAITVPEVIEQRFGPVTQQCYAWINVVLGLVYAALWLYGLSIFIAAVFGFDLKAVICVVGVVVVLYSFAGGNWAVMSTDFLQTLVLVPITLLVAYLALKSVGGWGGFLEQTRAPAVADDFRLISEPGRFAGQYTLVYAVAMMLKNIVGYNTITSSVRYFSVKDGREARKAALLGAALMAGGAVIWIIPPMVARMTVAADVHAVSIPKPAEASYAVISLHLLPPALIGLMVVAMLSATMSSMDTGLNRNAAIFTQDIYPRLCRMFGRFPREGRARLLVGQLFTVVFGVAIVLLALYFAGAKGDGVFEYMLTLGAVLALPLAVPMVLAIFIRRTPGWAALFSIACAAVPSAIGLRAGWSFEDKVFWNVGVGAAAYLATLPLWPLASAAYRTKVERFFERMHRPIDFETEVGRPNDLQQLSVLGGFALVLGVLVCLLGVLADSTGDLVATLFVGGFILTAGGLLIVASRRLKQTARQRHPEPSETASSTLPEPLQ